MTFLGCLDQRSCVRLGDVERRAPPVRCRCTTNRRRVSRLKNEAVLDRMAARLEPRPDILDRRPEILKYPFGSIK